MKMNEEAQLKVLESYTLVCVLKILLFLSGAFRVAIGNKKVCFFSLLQAGNLLTQLTNYLQNVDVY